MTSAQACRRVLEGIVSGAFDAATSVPTWNEFSYIVQRHLGREIATAEAIAPSPRHRSFGRAARAARPTGWSPIRRGFPERSWMRTWILIIQSHVSHW
jgi:hypothetical protein